MGRKEKKLKKIHGRAENYQVSISAQKNLLTISAEAYVASVEKKLSDFYFRSIDVAYMGKGEEIVPNDLEKTVLECKKQMIEKAEKLGAEVVVDIRTAISYNKILWHLYPIYMSGTALIPKKEKK